MAISHKRRVLLIKKLMEAVAPESEIVGLEIGVWKGTLLAYLLRYMPKIKKLYGIDSWAVCGTTRPYWSMLQWDDHYNAVLAVFGDDPRITLVRGKSQDVIDQVPNELHFVEIDGDHTYEQVRKDLEISYPKIVDGGLICGHDYYGPESTGVKRAVDEFAALKGKEVHSQGVGINEEMTWWWYK
jgi:hypothetical protein